MYCTSAHVFSPIPPSFFSPLMSPLPSLPPSPRNTQVCQLKNGGLYTTGAGHVVGEQMEQLWAQMKRWAGQLRLMKASRRIEYMELGIMFIRDGKLAGHRRALQDREVRMAKLKVQLEAKMEECLRSARAQLGLSPGQDVVAALLQAVEDTSPSARVNSRSGAASASSAAAPSEAWTLDWAVLMMQRAASAPMADGRFVGFVLPGRAREAIGASAKLDERFRALSLKNGKELFMKGWSMGDSISTLRENDDFKAAADAGCAAKLSEYALNVETACREYCVLQREKATIAVPDRRVQTLRGAMKRKLAKIEDELGQYHAWENINTPGAALLTAAALRREAENCVEGEFPWPSSTIVTPASLNGKGLDRGLVRIFRATMAELRRCEEDIDMVNEDESQMQTHWTREMAAYKDGLETRVTELLGMPLPPLTPIQASRVLLIRGEMGLLRRLMKAVCRYAGGLVDMPDIPILPQEGAPAVPQPQGARVEDVEAGEGEGGDEEEEEEEEDDEDYEGDDDEVEAVDE